MATQYTQAEYDALRQAIASGALSVSHDGETVTFRSASEMRALLAAMERSLGIRTSTRRRVHALGF